MSKDLESAVAHSGLLARARAVQDKVAVIAHPYALLLVRILFGYALFRAGWGKLTNLDNVTGFFADLGIPLAGVNAVLVAVLESAGGLMIMAGVATRATSAVLIPVLLVALGTAHTAELKELFSNPGAVAGAGPVPYLAVLVLLVVTGAGRLSVDGALTRDDAGSSD